MLYQIHELQHAAMNPIVQWSEAVTNLFSSAVSPLAYAPFAQNVAAGAELLYRIGKDYNKPSFNIKSVKVNGVEIGVQESVVCSKPFCKLLHFKKVDAHKAGRTQEQESTILLVAPLSGHHATLLRDTVTALLQEHEVYIPPA